jgi:hypothetical protein
MKTPRYLTHVARALVAAVGIVPVTIAGIALIRCGCSPVAWVLELGTAGLYWFGFSCRGRGEIEAIRHFEAGPCFYCGRHSDHSITPLRATRGRIGEP